MNNMLEILRAADEKYNAVVEAISGYVECGTKNETFMEIFGGTVRLPGICTAEKRRLFTKHCRMKPGIYLFVAARDFTMNKRDLKNYASLQGAGINRRHVSRLKVRKGEIFYIGSAQNIGGRIAEHYSSYSGNGSLHLDSEKRRLVAKNLTAYIFTLKEDFGIFSRELLRIIEGRLHEKYEPVAGIFR